MYKVPLSHSPHEPGSVPYLLCVTRMRVVALVVANLMRGTGAGSPAFGRKQGLPVVIADSASSVEGCESSLHTSESDDWASSVSSQLQECDGLERIMIESSSIQADQMGELVDQLLAPNPLWYVESEPYGKEHGQFVLRRRASASSPWGKYLTTISTLQHPQTCGDKDIIVTNEFAKYLGSMVRFLWISCPAECALMPNVCLICRWHMCTTSS